MESKKSIGHFSALITILIWGTTFISTKILLAEFEPIEILLFRFMIGFLALIVVYPHRLKGTTKKQEFMFAGAGLCGVCLYYLLENVALNLTLASNVGVIISVAPFFTAILTHFFMKNEEQLKANFFVGFVIAMVGICLIHFNGSRMQLNPMGDMLAIAAALVWAGYSILTRKISSFGFHTIQTTRRVFAYGIVFMFPALFLFEFHLGLERFQQPVYLFNMIFLGLGASALCFVTWNISVKILGAVKTSVYIYMVPVITVLTSVWILNEKITGIAIGGTLLTLVGLIISEGKCRMKRRGKAHECTK